MYKCSECGNEFEIMPKYCDCGNDIFITIDDDKQVVPQEIDELEEDNYDNEPARHRNFKKKSFSPMAIAIFSACIILSILILFVIGNPKKDTNKTAKDEIEQESVEIPSIDSYWDNTSVKLAQKEQQQGQKDDNIIDKIVQQIIPTPINTVATVSKTPVAQPKNETKSTRQSPKPITSTQKTQPKSQSTTKSQTPQTQTKTQVKTTQKSGTSTASNQTEMTFEDLTNKIRNQYNNQNTKSQTTSSTTSSGQKTNAPLPSAQSSVTQNTTQSIPKSQPVTTIQTQSKPQTQAQAQTQTQTQVQKPTKTTAQLKQELATYKSNLRNTIGRKIDFTKVIGDGECSLSFKINSSGRLTSKAFTKQSSNITLNDAAFNALNTTTSFNPPPEAYSGETLKLTIKFYNGNFEISLQ